MARLWSDQHLALLSVDGDTRRKHYPKEVLTGEALGGEVLDFVSPVGSGPMLLSGQRHSVMEEMEQGDGAVYARREGIVLREVAGEHILVPIRRNVADLKSIFALNDVGRCIWELLDGARGFDAVLAGLVERFDVSPEEASADLRSFVDRLSQAGLLERRG